MPVITVQFIKDVVATPEQKRQLVIELTNTFVGILGDVVRPFVYCIIQETPQGEWGIAGVPMPDLVYLTSEKHAQVIARSNELMRGAIAQMAATQANSNSAPTAAEADRRYWERWFDEMWNKKNYDYAFQIVDPNFTAHGAGGQDIKQGPDGVIGMIKAWHAAMPDGHMTIDDIITEGDLSTIRMTWEATQTGAFGNIPASNKRIKVTSTGIDRVVNGKITEGWGELDMLGMFQQMGAIPAPQQQQAQPTSTASQAEMETEEMSKFEERRALIRRMYDETNAGNAEILLELLAPNFTSYGGAGFQDLHGAEAFLNLYKTFTTAFPDLQFQVQQVVVSDDDFAAVRGIQTGTHLGNFLGMVPPTGKKVEWTGTAIFRFDSHNKIIERWQDLDNLSLFQQLGVIPPFGAGRG